MSKLKAGKIKISTVVDAADREWLQRVAERDASDLSTVLRRLVRRAREAQEGTK